MNQEKKIELLAKAIEERILNDFKQHKPEVDHLYSLQFLPQEEALINVNETIKNLNDFVTVHYNYISLCISPDGVFCEQEFFKFIRYALELEIFDEKLNEEVLIALSMGDVVDVYNNALIQKFYGRKYSAFIMLKNLERHLKFKNSLVGNNDLSISIKSVLYEPEITFKNNFDSLPESKVRDYFFNKLVSSGYLNEAELNEYLFCVFEQGIITSKFTLRKRTTKGDVISIFSKYYEDSYNPRGRKREYVRLLSDYFIGFDEQKVFNNFRTKLK
ncbi:hypothetical protein [Spongiimicrobium salis]|uniref:hypothetical protein n=1 Tax=Spongiimicrobium salis TaxID=1667022 RepID=UPI00374D6593